ncbi:MAG: hypothetical protein E6I60_14010 [Chloroflexi bacterium]|nr:MAG: hypothetical protein E6I60_14010 [Chloroflexota bacterium]
MTHALAGSGSARFRSASSRRFAVALTAAVLLGVVPALQSTSLFQAHIATKLTAGTGWLDRLNTWRTTTGLSALSENTTWSAGDYNHAVYMVKNDLVTHYETAGVPYYTSAGDTAAKDSNIYVSSTTSTPDEQAIDWWMGAPFHSMGLMDPRLTSTGFGSYREVKSGWQMGAAVDVIRGNPFTGGTFPVMWPANGSSEPLTSYSGNEFPDPLQACSGYSMPSGLPVFIEVGGNVSTTAGPVHSFTGNGVALEHCIIDSSNAAVGSYLVGRGGVIVVPRQPLQSGVNYVVALTVNGLPYTWSFTVGPFRLEPAGWNSLSGSLTSSPAASSWGANTADIFARGTDNALWHRHWDGTNWGGWESLGGVLTSDPAAVSGTTNRIDVFVRGTDNAVWHRSFNGTSWSVWDSVGGVATTAPAAASWGATRLDVVVAGTNNNGLWHRSWNGSGWSAWDSMGGVAGSNPSVVAGGTGRLDAFVRGTDGALWHRSGDGTSAWSAWDSLGGILTAGPAASSCAAGHLDVFVKGSTGTLWQQGFNGTAWSGWKLVGGYWTSGPAAVCPAGGTVTQLFARGPDNALWTGTAQGS